MGIEPRFNPIEAHIHLRLEVLSPQVVRSKAVDFLADANDLPGVINERRFDFALGGLNALRYCVYMRCVSTCHSAVLFACFNMQ